ncbi:MAG: iron ABC transporter permease [Clostridiales Family XIII bacterium]|jgi:iron complex transport system permease protein|nr:iron ABC transporter permease [Clostridiales Family XIII bacterium]
MSDVNDTVLQPDKKSYGARFAALALVLIFVFFVSFMLGRYPVNPADLVKILLSHLISEASRILPDALRDAFLNTFIIERTWESAAETVTLNVRLPRIAAAAGIGAALSAAGAAYQGMFRNPLVSPDILGASSGAGFGAAFGILARFGYLGISVSAFLFGIGAVLTAYAISGRSRRMSSILAMVLTGMMISSLFSAATSFIKLIADTDEILPVITYWLMGSLASIRNSDIFFAGIPIAAGLIILWLLRWRINLLTVGDEEAKSMGVDIVRLRTVVILCATLLTAASVSVSGMIGWVGLVIPHCCRMIFGHDYNRLMPASMMFGAAFLIVVDDAARLISASEVPIGILTAFVGAPVFVYLILSRGSENAY